MVKIVDIKSQEGGRHWRSKSLLFDFVTDNDCKFIDGNMKYDISRTGWDYVSMEAFAFDNDNTIPVGHVPPKLYNICKNHYELMDKDSNRYSQSIQEYNKNICLKGGEKVAYYNDPLNYCKYSEETDVRFIFDIALGRKGVYTAVIEVVNKSPVKRDKKDFFRKWGIDLITIRWEDVIKCNLPARNFRAEIEVNEINYGLIAKDFEEVG